MRPKVKLASRLATIVGLLALLLALGLGTASAQGTTHVVKAGETLATIAQAYGTSVKAIVSANSITNPDLLYVGQRLVIPGGSSGGAPAPAPKPRPSGNTTYVVKAGDTLGKIALKYGTTAAIIARANGLTSPNLIWVGMRLVIPGGARSAPVSAPSGKASRLVVSISGQHCWLYQGNAVVGSWACSTGRRGWPTRPGSYRIQSKLSRAYGSTWNIMMPYWLGIYWAGSTENGIHGLPWNASSGARTWDGLVGTRITYGCVMLSDAAAKLLWNMAYIGMPVIIKA